MEIYHNLSICGLSNCKEWYSDRWLAAARHTSIMAFFQILWACRASRSSLHTELHNESMLGGRRESIIKWNLICSMTQWEMENKPVTQHHKHYLSCDFRVSFLSVHARMGFTHNCDEAGLLGMESAAVWSWRDEDAVWRLYPSSLSLAAGSSSVSPSGSDKNPSAPSPSSSAYTSGPLTSLCTWVPEVFCPRPTLTPFCPFVSCNEG